MKTKCEKTNQGSGMTIKTKFGIFYLEATRRGIARLNFPSGNTMRSVIARRSEGSTKQSQYRDCLASLAMTAKIKKYIKKTCHLLKKYLSGKATDFSQIKIDFSGYSNFEKRVLKALAQTRNGETLTYAELARRAASPRASRAVGTVMRKNRLPIILPCHRVLRTGGALGGYSQGLAWKKRLLELEKRMV